MNNFQFIIIIFELIPIILCQWNRWGNGMNSFGAINSRWAIPGFDEDDDFGANYGSNSNQQGGNGIQQQQQSIAQFSNVVGRRPFIIVQQNSMPSAALIFFHGMGDQGDGWAQTFQNDFLPNLRQMKFICPNAKSSEDGMTQWFEYQGLDLTAAEDLEGLNAVKNYAHYLIDGEIANGIPANRIFLGGFSQGGPVALYAGLSYPEPLGGILSLSGFLLPKDILLNPIRQIPWLNQMNTGIPIFIGHGQQDPNVPFSIAILTVNALRRFNSNVQFRAYQMGHSICLAEIKDIFEFIHAIAPSNF